jgi:hypothetical protein
LLELANDIYCGADQGRRTLLIQFDPSAAVDMIDSNIMPRRLKHYFGLTGVTLSWVWSYITGRMQIVRFGDCCAATTINMFGVPQGSVLGLMLSSLYVAPIADVINAYDVMHTYSTQMTFSSTSGCVEPVQQQLLVRSQRLGT